MSNQNDSTNYLKIDEAARLLRVTRRTIYRRIWSGDLPATKTGGLYLIRREDVQALLEKGQVTSGKETNHLETTASSLKCGSCYRLIGSDTQIGDVCLAEGCEELICTACLSEGIQYCARHSPTRDQKWAKALSRFQRGEIPVLVKAGTARLRELNFLNRIQVRISRINSLIHPLSGEALTISNWEAYLQSGDERAEVMRLLGKVLLDSETVTRQPLNAFLRYLIPQQKGQKGLPVEILVEALSRLPEMIRDGFSTQPMGVEDLAPWLSRFSDQAQRSQTFKLVVLASTTGWDAASRLAIQGVSSGEGFAHRTALFYLFDLEKGELLYNLNDDRSRRYAELFAPLLPSEELEEVTKAVENELVIHDSLTFQYATQILPYPQHLIRQAFERLAATGGFALTDLPDLGAAIVRHT
jgi:excisionase family DNA binding protein